MAARSFKVLILCVQKQLADLKTKEVFMNKKLSKFFAAGLLMLGGAANALPNDFSAQADGISEILVVEQGERQLRWRTLDSQNQFNSFSALGPFGAKTATAAAGHWFGNGRASKAVLGANGTGASVLRVLAGDGSTVVADLPGSVSQVMAGFDFNGNAIADLLVRQSNGNFLIVNDPLISRSEQELTFPAVVKNKGLPIFANLGAGRDAVGYLYRVRKDQSSAAGISAYLVSSDGSIFKSRMKRVRARKYRSIFPIQGTDGRDQLLYAWSGSNRLNFEVRNLSGRRVYRGLLEADGKELTVGNYLADAGEEFAIRTSIGVILVNPFTKGQKFVPFESAGIVSDHILIARNSKSWTGDSVVGEGVSAVCSSIKGFPFGVLWKPASQDSGGTREGRPVVLFQDEYTPNLDEVKIYATNGEQITQFGVYERGSYERYYSGYGSGEDLFAGEIAALARAKTGNSRIYVQGRGGSCHGPIEPTQRHGGLR